MNAFASCLLLVSSAVSLGQAPAKLQAPEPARKLNVLLIVSDDLNTALGCYGNPVVKTPHVDRLAKRAVRFDRAYCNYPVCNPSRASFLSGLYPERTGVLNNATPPRSRLGAEFVFLPERFRAAGYFTARVGKIAHTPFEDAVRWDVSEFASHVQQKKAKKLKAAGEKKKKTPKTAAGDVPFAWQATDNADADEPDGRSARRIAQLLDQNKDRPFFIAAGLHRPHVPHTAPKKYFDLYPPDKMPLPEEPPGHAKHIPAIAHGQKYFPDLPDRQKREIISHYYASVSFMDAQVGVILEALDRLNLWDSTIVVFVGDHGWHLGEHVGFWAKVSLLEESARVPLLVAAPGRSAGKSSPRVVDLVDLYPTLCELARLKAPSELDGKSFIPLLADPEQAWNKAAYTVVTRKGGLGRSLRTERWTYIEWPDGSRQLYDAVKDRREYVNLAGEAEYADVERQMRERMAERKPR